MSDSSPNEEDQKTGAWAPSDYTDGRLPGEWKTFYPSEARKGIRGETWYLVLLTLAYLLAAFYIVHECVDTLDAPETVPNKTAGSVNHTFLGFLGAWIGGALGGCSFGLKWMYHSVAKRIWHEDRRLWRILAPNLCGLVSLFMVFLVASGLLQLFDKNFVQRPIAVMAFSFLVGLFSDKALAKMAEVADTLFGGQKKE